MLLIKSMIRHSDILHDLCSYISNKRVDHKLISCSVIHLTDHRKFDVCSRSAQLEFWPTVTSVDLLNFLHGRLCTTFG